MKNATAKEMDEQQLRARCVELLGWAFDDRTWRNWKRLCQILPHCKSIPAQSVVYLMALVALKKEQPNRKLSLFRIQMELADKRFDQWVKLLSGLDERAMLKPCYGRELPKFIYDVFGIRVTERSLYNWGEEDGGILYDRNRLYNMVQVSWWLTRAQKMPQKRKQQVRKTLREKLYATQRDYAVA